jgi:hypothetical protein
MDTRFTSTATKSGGGRLCPSTLMMMSPDAAGTLRFIAAGTSLRGLCTITIANPFRGSNLENPQGRISGLSIDKDELD